MNRSRLAIVVLAFALGIRQPEAATAERSVLEVASRIGAVLEWDSLSRSGTFVVGPDRLSFAVDRRWMLGNGRERIEIQGVVSSRGAVLVDDAAAAAIEQWFAARAEGASRWRIGAVLIDPGHGGRDPGAVRQHTIDEKTVTVREKDVVLEIALRLEKLLQEGHPGRTILLSRTDDTYLGLEERTELANSIPLQSNEAIVFISIHANSALVSKPRGYEVWVQPPEYRRRVLDEEELSEEERELWPILNSMREDEFNLESTILAQMILDGLDHEVGELSESRGIKQEAWAVVRNALMPAVLVEVGFISNEEEAALLTRPEYLQRIAMGICAGIDGFTRKFEGSMNFLP